MRSTGGPGHVRYRLNCRQRVEVRRLRFVTLLGLGQEPGTSPLTDGKGTTSYHSVRVTPATQASPAPPDQTGPFALQRGSALRSPLAFPRPRARPRRGDGGIEGDFSGRREMDFERRLSLLDEASDGRLCDQPLSIPLDPPIPLSRDPRAPRRSGGERDHGAKPPVPIWLIPCLAPPTLPWRCSPRERCCSRRKLAVGTIPLVRACSWLPLGGVCVA